MPQVSLSKSVVGCVALAVLAALLGCAEGSVADFAQSELATLPADAGSEEDGSVVLPPSSQPGATGATSSSDAGAGAGSDAGAPSGGAAATGACASANACTSATDLGSISGDTGADTKTAQGSAAQWFTVRVTEDDSGVFPLSLRSKVELTSPPGANFDVYVYVAASETGQECSAVTTSSTNPSGVDAATADWGESGVFANGSEDGRTVTIEVRWVSGTCNPATPWALTVRGNTP